jgi:Formate--tetrahydrofolate ligase
VRLTEDCGIAEGLCATTPKILRDAKTLPETHGDPPRLARKPSATPQPSATPTAIFRHDPAPTPRPGPEHVRPGGRRGSHPAGAGFIYLISGDMCTMPGLSAHPAAEHIDIDERGDIVGLK